MRPAFCVPGAPGEAEAAAATTEQVATGEASPGLAAGVGGGEAALHQAAPPWRQSRAHRGADCAVHTLPRTWQGRGPRGSRSRSWLFYPTL